MHIDRGDYSASLILFAHTGRARVPLRHQAVFQVGEKSIRVQGGCAVVLHGRDMIHGTVLPRDFYPHPDSATQPPYKLVGIAFVGKEFLAL